MILTVEKWRMLGIPNIMHFWYFGVPNLEGLPKWKKILLYFVPYIIMED